MIYASLRADSNFGRGDGISADAVDGRETELLCSRNHMDCSPREMAQRQARRPGVGKRVAVAHFVGPASKRRRLDIGDGPTCVCRQLMR